MSSVKSQEWWRQDIVTSTGNQDLGEPASAETARESALPFYAMLLFTFILLLAPQQIFPFLAPLRIAMLSIVLVCVTHIGSRLSRGLPIMYFPGGVVIALLLVAWAIITVPVSIWPGGSVAFLTEKYLKTILVFFLLASVINTRERFFGICWALVIMSVPLALTAIKNLLTGATLGGSQRIVGYDAPLAENPNDMALLLNLFLPLTIGFCLSATGKFLKLVLAGLILLMIGAIVATFSRAGFLTLGVIFLCYLVMMRNRPERFFAPAILLLVVFALPFMPGDYVGRISTITNIEEDETGSAQTRLSDMIAASKIVMANPIIGSGIGTNTLAMNEIRGATWTEIHNVYLTLGVELGLPGMLLFVAMTIAAWRSVQSIMNQTRNRPTQYKTFCLAEGLKVSLIAFSASAFFYPVAYHFFFYYIAGLAMALAQVNRAASGVTTGQRT